MTTVVLEQMVLMLPWVLIGDSDEIVSNAPKRALQLQQGYKSPSAHHSLSYK